jgi:hypothetical protein
MHYPFAAEKKKQINILFTFDFDIRTFLGWVEPGDFYRMHCHFVSWSY